MKNYAIWSIGIAVLAVLSFCTLFNHSPVAQYEPMEVDAYTAGDFDQLRINKTYLLSPSESPSNIPTEDFVMYGRSFSLLGTEKEEMDGKILYTAVFADAGTPYSNTSVNFPAPKDEVFSLELG